MIDYLILMWDANVSQKYHFQIFRTQLIYAIFGDANYL